MSGQTSRVSPERASIRTRLGAVFLGFFLLVAGSVGATFVTIRTQATDALVINLAGRQRMLAQQMAKATLGVAYQDATQDQHAGYQSELQHAASSFDLTLQSLRQGGSVPYGDQNVTLPAATNVAVRTQLDAVAGLWDQLQVAVEEMGTEAPGSTAFVQSAREVERLAPTIVEEMDRAVRLSEAAAVTKLKRLRTIQTAFFISAVGLLGAGYLLTQRTIVHPLLTLTSAACQIAGGDLDSPVVVTPEANSEVL